MSLFKVLFWATTWLAAWLLLAKKSWKEFREDLNWKSNEEKSKIIWKEILSMWKDLVEELKNDKDTASTIVHAKLVNSEIFDMEIKNLIDEGNADIMDF